MSIPDKKELANELYDALLYTTGAVGVSMVSKKVIKEPLGKPKDLKGTIKLAAMVGAGTILVNYLHGRKILPIYPFGEQ